MARKVDYAARIEKLTERIGKTEERLERMKAKLDDTKEKYQKGKYKELTDYMEKNNLTASEVLASIQGDSTENE